MKRLSQVIDVRLVDELVKKALLVRLLAHAPYSKFQVGAALLAHDEEIFVGCNIENASFSLTICAERVAAGTAVASGHVEWVAIAIASRGGVTPCGACRQFLAEFGHDLLVLSVDADTQAVKRYQLSDLLPFVFDKNALHD